MRLDSDELKELTGWIVTSGKVYFSLKGKDATFVVENLNSEVVVQDNQLILTTAIPLERLEEFSADDATWIFSRSTKKT